jgi:ankyrin repeat protein
LDKAGNAPIHWASRGGHDKVVQLLLQAQATVNVQNKLGDTPLHMAAWGGHPKVVELLLAVPGIQTNVRNNEKMRPVDLAKVDQVAALLVNFTGTPGAQTMAGDSDEDE